MTGRDRVRLLFGPYQAPRCQVGDVLHCELQGQVVVAGFSAGPIPWPTSREQGKAALILCGDLAEAVRRESRRTVSDWWGVSYATVGRWRRALGVPTDNEGTRRQREVGAASRRTGRAAS